MIDNLDIVLGMNVIHLHHGATALEIDGGVSKTGGHHPDRAVVIEPEKYSWGKQHLGSPFPGGQLLSGFEGCVAHRFGREEFPSEFRPPFNIVNCSWTGWVRAERRRAQSRQGKQQNHSQPGHHRLFLPFIGCTMKADDTISAWSTNKRSLLSLRVVFRIIWRNNGSPYNYASPI